MVKVYKRLLKSPNSSFLLLGVRGVGKSSWAAEVFKEKPIIYDLLDENLYGELLYKKSSFYEELSTKKAGTWVVVDEVQRIPGLLNECHRLIEKNKLKFALLGSSARKLKKVGVNLLGGRASSLELYPLTPEELGSDFKLDQFLKYGGIPLIATSDEPAIRLKAYMQNYLKEEIQQEALVRNLEGFARFIVVAGIFHGQVLNAESLSRDSGVARSTVLRYLSILEDTLLAFRLSAFEGRLRVKEKKHPKFYWVDPGLARAAKRQYGELSPEEKGVLFEGFIIQLIRSYNSYHGDIYDDIYYWSSGGKQNSVEVDLILLRGKDIIAIEIKSGTVFNKEWTRGLSAVSELKGVSRKIIVYTGPRYFVTEDKIEVMPTSNFYALLAEGKL